jgi:hypothetical protein
MYAEEGRRGLEQLRQSRLLFTNEETGRQNGDGDWSKRVYRKMHRVCVLFQLRWGWRTRLYGSGRCYHMGVKRFKRGEGDC